MPDRNRQNMGAPSTTTPVLWDMISTSPDSFSPESVTPLLLIRLTIRFPVSVSSAVPPHRTQLTGSEGQGPLQGVQRPLGAGQGSSSPCWTIVTCASRGEWNIAQKRKEEVGMLTLLWLLANMAFPGVNHCCGQAERYLHDCSDCMTRVLLHSCTAYLWGSWVAPRWQHCCRPYQLGRGGRHSPQA